MNTNTMELNLDEMEMVNGGWNWKNFFETAGVGGTIGALCGTVVGIATGPVGWCALGGALILGGTCGAIAGAKDEKEE